MNIRYFYKNAHVDDETKSYIEKRLGKLEKFLSKILRVEVEIEKDKKNFFRVEIMIKTPHHLFRAEEISKDIKTSADIAVDELKIQIRRKKEKMWTKIIRKARSVKKRFSVNKDARF